MYPPRLLASIQEHEPKLLSVAASGSLGLCGRCDVGPFSVCRDGPVVTWAELNELPKDY